MDLANLLDHNRNAASSGSLSDRPAIEPSPMRVPHSQITAVPSRRKFDRMAENNHSSEMSRKRSKPNHAHDLQVGQASLKFWSARTPKNHSKILNGINQNFAGNYQPSNGECDMVVKESTAEISPSQNRTMGQH
jgi:hypothetical protein